MPVETTKVSSKGQVVLPKAIREAKQWKPGTELTVEVRPEGILLRPVPLFPRTTLDQAAGCLKYSGPPASIEDMDKSIEREIRRRHARGRY